MIHRMEAAKHPSYPNPTIREAVCEIHFRQPSDVAWKPTLPAELFKRIQQEFPEMEPVQEAGLEVQVGPEGLQQRWLPGRQRMRFRHAERPHLLQLSEELLTVNELQPYPGWDTMRSDIGNAWTRLSEVASLHAVTRVGLRYINVIPRTEAGQAPTVWLKATRYIPEATLESPEGYFSRVRAQLSATDRVIVTLGETTNELSGQHGGIVFDIDRITEEEIAASEEAVLSVLDRLHEDVWTIFAEARTPLLQQLLEGRKR